MRLVHWPLMGGLLRLVQREEACAGCRPGQLRCEYDTMLCIMYLTRGKKLTCSQSTTRDKQKY